MMQFALSAAGIALLVGLAWVLGFRGSPVLADAEAAMQVARDALPGFEPVEAILDAKGNGALVRGRDGRVVLMRAMGDRWVVRGLDPACAALDGDRLTLRVRETGFGAATLDLGADAGRWAALLA